MKIKLVLALSVIVVSLIFGIALAYATAGIWIGPNAYSNLSVTTNEVNLDICAGNLRNNSVEIFAFRDAANGYPGRYWHFIVTGQGVLQRAETRTYDETRYTAMSGVSTSRWDSGGVPCIRANNLDGAGQTFDNVTYYTNARYLHTPALPGFPFRSSCYGITDGRYLCDRRSR
jgi:hypothetical protein